MSMDQLMALVPIEAAKSLTDKGRKSRWEKAKERKGGTRWGNADDKIFLPPPYVDLPPGLTPAQIDQFLREQRFDELGRRLATGELEYGEPDIRPPSPPPIYDKFGSRVNTREVRVRALMTAEYQRLVEYLVKHVEGFCPPADFKPIKKIRRIEIPLEKYPEYNFMGLIIGPRGCNHKRLEAESGAQISIRGKGTQKEGKRTDHQTDEEASMPMHVHVAADSEEAVEKAVSLIEPLLDPFHPMHEEFKKRGLEQLALVNGVNFGQLDQQRCAVCGALGHLAYECPDTQTQTFKRPNIKCAICGDAGHVTMDCKFAKDRLGADVQGTANLQQSYNPSMSKNPTDGQQQFNEKFKMDQEYKKMMNELCGDGGSTESLPAASTRNNAGMANGATRPSENFVPAQVPPPPPFEMDASGWTEGRNHDQGSQVWPVDAIAAAGRGRGTWMPNRAGVGHPDCGQSNWNNGNWQQSANTSGECYNLNAANMDPAQLWAMHYGRLGQNNYVGSQRADGDTSQIPSENTPAPTAIDPSLMTPEMQQAHAAYYAQSQMAAWQMSMMGGYWDPNTMYAMQMMHAVDSSNSTVLPAFTPQAPVVQPSGAQSQPPIAESQNGGDGDVMDMSS